jgi:hypothetical protein
MVSNLMVVLAETSRPRRLEYRLALYATERRQVLLRVDPAVHDALMRCATDEFRSYNAQVEMLLRRALADEGRLPRDVAPMPRRGRPPSGR